MQPAPRPSDAEQCANATYEALMWALARPGLPRDLPGSGAAQIVDALIDRECAVHCAVPALMPALRRCGADIVAPEVADHVLAGSLHDTALLDRLRCGSDLYPDDGATLVAEAAIGTGPMVRLTGPGVDGHVDCRIGDLPDGFWTARAQVMRYPMGFELFLIDGARVLGIPRSTAVEAL